MKKVVYTVLLGNYKLNEPKHKNPEWEHLCFTDQDIHSKNWKIIKVKGGKKRSREIKIRSDQFFSYDVCLYLDARFTIKCDLDAFVKEYLKTDLCVMEHNKRKCAYKEGEFITKLGIDKKTVIDKQLSVYREMGFPEDFGLYAPGIMIKRNTPKVNHFMQIWYEQVDKYSYRDIISFSYTLWKNPIDLSLMPFKPTYRRFS